MSANSPPVSNLVPAVRADESSRRFSWGHEGLLIGSEEGFYSVRIHGYLQSDGRLFVDNLAGRDHAVFLFRRVRPLVEGRLSSGIDFRFMPDFGEGNTVVQEAYAEWNSISALRMRIGKFKTPIGLEVLRSDRDLTFGERSLASDLVPLRDLGGQIEGSFLQDAVGYEVAWLSGTNDGSNANFEWRGSNEAVMRTFFQPFVAAQSNAARELGIGLAASVGTSRNPLPDFKTTGQETFFRYVPGALADGEQRRLSPQARYYLGPVGVMAEYAASGQKVRAGTASRYLSNEGWEVAGSWILTGEKNSFEGIEPAHPLEFSRNARHLGAWEVALRHSTVEFDPHAFPLFAAPGTSADGASESAAGVNWYINRYTRLLVNYEYTGFPSIPASAARSGPEHLFLTRVQLAF